MTLRLVLAALTLTVGGGSTPQTSPSPDVVSKVNAVFARMDTTTSPGCALSVMREGRIVFSRGYGMANLDHDVVITPSTIFHVASVSKQFTAAAIALLAQDGRLQFDDDVRRHLPELPDFGHPITLRQLIHHTSGLRDQWDLLGLAGWRYSLDLITDADVLYLMTRQKELNFRPGDEHLYSNSGYTLLALVVSRVSGQSFRAFTTERIFAPLGMTRTFFRDDHAEIIKQQAYGYVPAGAGFRLSVTNFDTAGATSLHTTAEDLARWDRNFYDGRVGGRAFMDQLGTRGALNNGERLDYAIGLTHGTYRGLPTIGHGGSDAGYRSQFLRFPTESLSIACLCNLSTSNPGVLTRQVADVILADRLGPAEGPPPLPAAVAVTPQDLARPAGLYGDRATRVFRRFFVGDGALRLGFGNPGAALVPIGRGRFASPATEYRFDTGPDGRPRVTEYPRTGGSSSPVTYEALEAFAPSAVDAAAYAGSYRSDEIDPVYRLVLTDGRLTLHRVKFPPAVLEPLTRDVFRAGNVIVEFVRDGDGRVSGFLWTSGRVRALRFARDRDRP